jgi:hypothetical protein
MTVVNRSALLVLLACVASTNAIFKWGNEDPPPKEEKELDLSRMNTGKHVENVAVDYGGM